MKKIFIFVTILFSFFFLSSCRGNNRADRFYNVKWKSEEPIVEFIVKSKEEIMQNEDGVNYGFLYKNGEKIEIGCLWTVSHGIDAFLIDKIAPNHNFDDGDVAFRGNYKMSNNKLVLEINLDNIFGNKYDTITFTMEKLGE